MTAQPLDGRDPIDLPGFTYLPRLMSAAEGDALAAYFASLTPLWERRYADGAHARQGGGAGRLTRPVYWLGAWQFACLGYYAEPDHVTDRSVRAEPIPASMQTLLDRLGPTLAAHDPARPEPPNTCLINYYGRGVQDGPPVDYARLRMHRDAEPGPVVMFSVGQPGLFEMLEPDRLTEPELAVWLRHRSAVVFSGPRFKDHLYHRVTRVRYGQAPALTCRVPGFEVRRVSVSFRHVPESAIADLDDLGLAARADVLPYVETLAETSAHFRDQLARLTGAPAPRSG